MARRRRTRLRPVSEGVEHRRVGSVAERRALPLQPRRPPTAARLAARLGLLQAAHAAQRERTQRLGRTEQRGARARPLDLGPWLGVGGAAHEMPLLPALPRRVATIPKIGATALARARPAARHGARTQLLLARVRQC